MIGLKFKSSFDKKPLSDAVAKARIESLEASGLAIEKTAQSLFQKSSEPSEPGSPPHTQTEILPEAIVHATEGERELIGPSFSLAGDSGHPHEFGGEYRGNDYEARPFMLPALKMSLETFAASWHGSIGK